MVFPAEPPVVALDWLVDKASTVAPPTPTAATKRSASDAPMAGTGPEDGGVVTAAVDCTGEQVACSEDVLPALQLLLLVPLLGPPMFPVLLLMTLFKLLLFSFVGGRPVRPSPTGTFDIEHLISMGTAIENGRCLENFMQMFTGVYNKDLIIPCF